MADTDLSAEEAWVQLQDLLRAAADDSVLPREMATRYTSLRDNLIRSDRARQLPGFMHQCLTLDRFRDFIRLYHPRLDARIEFLNRSLRTSAPRSRRLARDFLADAES